MIKILGLMLGIILMIKHQHPTTSHHSTSQLAIINANIWTTRPQQPWAEALFCQDNTISMVGTTCEISTHITSRTHTIDARGNLVLPGFIDCHVHFLEGGFRLASVALRDANTPAEFIARTTGYEQTLEPGRWITGGDWDHALWGGELPHRSYIDSLTKKNQVWVSLLDGHMARANSKALALAGVTARTTDIDGGTIVHDRSREPTGILKDNAMSLIDKTEQNK